MYIYLGKHIVYSYTEHIPDLQIGNWNTNWIVFTLFDNYINNEIIVKVQYFKIIRFNIYWSGTCPETCASVITLCTKRDHTTRPATPLRSTHAHGGRDVMNICSNDGGRHGICDYEQPNATRTRGGGVLFKHSSWWRFTSQTNAAGTRRKGGGWVGCCLFLLRVCVLRAVVFVVCMSTTHPHTTTHKHTRQDNTKKHDRGILWSRLNARNDT